jgi:hypothetical protein
VQPDPERDHHLAGAAGTICDNIEALAAKDLAELKQQGAAEDTVRDRGVRTELLCKGISFGHTSVCSSGLNGSAALLGPK